MIIELYRSLSTVGYLPASACLPALGHSGDMYVAVWYQPAVGVGNLKKKMFRDF